MFNDLLLLLGDEFADYPFLVAVATLVVFCLLVNTAFSLIRDVLERVAGYK